MAIADIVIITSAQPSANPRAVKEATALSAAGYKVTVIYAPLSPWADPYDEELFRQTPGIQWGRAGYHMIKQPWLYKWARLRRKLYEKAGMVIPSLKAYEYSFILFSQELWKAASKVRAGLYIAHNLGALPVAVKAARKYRALVAFDAEDYHSGEAGNDAWRYTSAKAIEDEYMNQLSYLSVASPLIGEAYGRRFGKLKRVVINNVFSKQYLQPLQPIQPGDPFRMVWVSQTLGPGRGVEDIVKAMGQVGDNRLHCTFVGNCSDEMKANLLTLARTYQVRECQLAFIPPVNLPEMFRICGRNHIGLATETGRDENNERALSNKIFSYVLSSLAIIASDTAAQAAFMQQYPGVGYCYQKNDPTQLSAIIKNLLLNPALLNQCREKSHALASHSLNWETESGKLLSIIKTLA